MKKSTKNILLRPGHSCPKSKEQWSSKARMLRNRAKRYSRKTKIRPCRAIRAQPKPKKC